jgi:tRNA modification GTPase
MNYPVKSSTICALATGGGISAIAVIRLSGPDAFEIGDRCFSSKSGKKLINQAGNTLHFGNFINGNRIIDEVLVSVFKAPHSYTAEHTLEFNCHGSTYIQQEILTALFEAGAIPAKPGEFTRRAFLNGKLDLSQAEAVADLIISENKAAHQLAMQQLRGGYSEEIKKLRQSLLNFAALIELELDFSTEDVEFADRSQLKTLVNHILSVITALHESFKWGNALKSGIPVAIIGKPNAGKSTLLNALLNEERAIVSEIPGTTRDTIEDVFVLDGTAFRFIDTAGLRETTDQVESIGIARTYSKIREAEIILYLFDLNSSHADEIISELEELKKLIKAESLIIPLGNKADKLPSYSNGFDGIDLDFEGFAFVDGNKTWTKTAPNWVQFIKELSTQLHLSQKLLSVTTPYAFDPSEKQKGYTVYAWADIAASIDRLRIMTYDYSVAKPGPIGPIAWTEKTLKYAISIMPASKVFIGLPGYGRGWSYKIHCILSVPVTASDPPCSAVGNTVFTNSAADVAFEVGGAQAGKAFRVPGVHERNLVQVAHGPVGGCVETAG